MKFAIFVMALVSLLPLSLLARSNDRVYRTLWVCLGCLPLFVSAVPLLNIGIISWGDQWFGFVHGVEVSAVDFVAIICFLSLKRIRPTLWHFAPLCIYILVAAASMYQAPQPLAAFFGVWQLMRVLLVAFIIASAFEDARVPFLILKGMALGIAINAGFSIWQHFVLGMTQAPGLFIHQNTLGLIAHFVLYPHLALLLATRRETPYLFAAVLSCLLVIVLTASRGAVGLAAPALAITYVLVVLSGATQRLLGIALAGVVFAAALTPLAVSAFTNRFDKTPLSEDVYDERAAFNRTAAFIFNDHPFGVGMNHYVYFANAGGYVDRAGVMDDATNRNNIVHNAYWLAAAETGFLGVAAFASVLFGSAMVAVWAALRIPNSAYRALLFGYATAIVMVALHSTLEWIIFIGDSQYMLGVTIGSISLVATQSAYRHLIRRRPFLENNVVLSALAKRQENAL